MYNEKGGREMLGERSELLKQAVEDGQESRIRSALFLLYEAVRIRAERGDHVVANLWYVMTTEYIHLRIKIDPVRLSKIMDAVHEHEQHVRGHQLQFPTYIPLGVGRSVHSGGYSRYRPGHLGTPPRSVSRLGDKSTK